jgi:hypothetical protein
MSELKYEPWIQTVSGRKIHFLNPSPEEIDITDIAFALSNLCRFNGHVRFYSVAEHSFLVSTRLDEEDKLAGLLHDAAEAYLSDIPSPIKQYLPEYRAIEDKLLACIFEKFGVQYNDRVKKADKDQTYNEAKFLLKDSGADWVPTDFPYQYIYEPVCIAPAMAYKLFMGAFKKLTNDTPTIIIPSNA